MPLEPAPIADDAHVEASRRVRVALLLADGADDACAEALHASILEAAAPVQHVDASLAKAAATATTAMRGCAFVSAALAAVPQQLAVALPAGVGKVLEARRTDTSVLEAGGGMLRIMTTCETSTLCHGGWALRLV